MFENISKDQHMDQYGPCIPWRWICTKAKKIIRGPGGLDSRGKKCQKSRDTAVLTVVQYVVAQWHTSK